MLPIVLEMQGPERWRNTVIIFAQSLRSAFGTRLLRVIALPSPEDEVYESNILVVIKSATQEDVRKVMDIAVRSGENLNPLVVNEEDEEAVAKFMGAARAPGAEWGTEPEIFAQSLRSAFGTRLLRVIALPSPEDEVYESNILVVIEHMTQEDVRKVMDIAVRSGENLNPLVVNEEDEEAVAKFIGSGGMEI